MDRRSFIRIGAAGTISTLGLGRSLAKAQATDERGTLLGDAGAKRDSAFPQVQSLAGEWRFEIAPGDASAFTRALPGSGKIKLPGTMDEAGLGPRDTKPPSLDGPYRLYDYKGPAWYQREIEVPEAWLHSHITLYLERCRWVTRVWLDDQYIGTHDSLIAPHIYDLGTGMAAGAHRLTVCVDNTEIFSLGKFVSVLHGGTPGNMNGIIGRVELHATPPVWLEDIQVYPDVEKNNARVVVRIGNATGSAGHGTLRVGDQVAEAKWDEKGGLAEVALRIDKVRLWDEFSPNLQQVTVRLGEDGRTVTFGMRQFAVRGTQFTMNGRPLFLRGTVECSTWPLTGCPPMEAPAWRDIYQTIKAYGMNHIRFHSWCPPEAAFAAADMEGIIIHVEGDQANIHDGADPAREAFIGAELNRIVDTYGNHPSFCLMAIGNECSGSHKVAASWVDTLIKRDPRHLYSSSAGGIDTLNRQWTETAAGRGIHGPGTERDLRDVVLEDHRRLQKGGFSEAELRGSELWNTPVPVLGHEIGQWTFFPDFAEIKKYTGVMRLKNFEIVRNDLAQKHLLQLEPEYLRACGMFAVQLYKEEIEQLLRTPGYGGFTLLALNDYPTQGTALVGPLNDFWESKGFITPEAFRAFCGPTVPLLRMPKRVYSIDEQFSATVDLAHFGLTDMSKTQSSWNIKDERGRQIASGSFPPLDAPVGKLTALGVINASLDQVHVPAKLTVSVSCDSFSNSWDIWVYPAIQAVAPPKRLAVFEQWKDAAPALAAGKTVLLFPEKPAESLPGKFLPVFWSPVWFPNQVPNTMGILCDPRHPVFARFPTGSCSDWQWWDLLNHSHSIILDDTPSGFRPIVQVIDNFARNHKLANLFEARVGAGRLLVCSIDLPHLANTSMPANQLLMSLYAYADSSAFHPAESLEMSLIGKLLSSGR